MKKIKSFFSNILNLNKTLLVTLTLSFILIIITFSLELTYEYPYKSIWDASSLKDLDLMRLFYSFPSFFPIIAIGLVLIFIVNFVLYVISVLKLIKQHKKIMVLNINVYLNIIIILIIFILNMFFRLYNIGLWFILITNTIINIVSLVTFKYYINISKPEILMEKENSNLRYIFVLFDVIGMLILFSTLIIPIFTMSEHPYYIVNILMGNYTQIHLYILGIGMFMLYFESVVVFISTFASFLSNEKKYIQKSQNLNKLNLFIVTIFFLTAIGFIFWFRIKEYEINTISYIIIIINVIFYFIYTYFQGKLNMIYPKAEKNEKNKKDKLSLAPLIFVFVFTLITFASLFINIIEIKFEFQVELFDVFTNQTKLTGLQLLKDYQNLNEIYQAIAFFYVVTLLSSTVLLVLSITKFLGKAVDYHKTIKIAVNTNVLFAFLFNLIGLFFKFNQKYTQINIKVLLEHYGLSLPTDYVYKVGTQSFYIFLASLFLLILMIVTQQYNLIGEGKVVAKEEYKNQKEHKELNEVNQVNNNPVEENIDKCPAFTELDLKKKEYEENLKNKQKHLFENPSLPKLVNFIMNYACNSRLHLFFTYEDLATFIAGLGTSRLAILQGLSGTGKTSLPKIFAEAIMGNCEIIEVESSWRDKNELLGYYNEFTGRYTPKKFTQGLYKAKLNPGIPTFIVLDEMNLSRIEYYFSDFLSLMEAEENKREIKLVNVKLFSQTNEGKIPYLALKDGHTIEIPNNVWFIGTANRDNSTFEISDKVYDRAMTMNFYKRAPKIRYYEEELENKFIPYEILSNLFKEAKDKIEFDAENDMIIQEVEKLLAPYNITFGNRILKHIEDFVKIYYACFLNQSSNSDEVMKNAVETIILSKVVSKLEFKQLDNREKLANSFDKLQLHKCSAFIRRLIED